MGNLLSPPPQPLPMPMVLKRLNEQIVPDDKVNILNLVEMIDASLTHPKLGPSAAVLMKELQGMKLLLRILKRMLEDAEMVSASMQVFEAIKFNTPLVMDFIQYGGLDLLEKAMRMHVKDDFISVTSPKLFNILSTIGAGVSRSEIDNEGLNLQLCQKCQETIERSKKKDYFEACVVIPRSSERANRVLKFMDNYLPREDVQIAGLDAIINFVRNSDGKVQTRETNLIDVLGRVVKAHTESTEVIWRTCMVLTNVVSFNGELANDVANLGIHDTLIDCYPNFERSPSVQQQILWLLAAFLEWPKSKRIIHRSAKCVTFFKAVTRELDFKPPPEEVKKDVLVNTLAKQGLIPALKGANVNADKTATAAAGTGAISGKSAAASAVSGVSAVSGKRDSNAGSSSRPKSPGGGRPKSPGRRPSSPKGKEGKRSSKPDKEAAAKAAAVGGGAGKGGKNDPKVAVADAGEEGLAEEEEEYVRKEFELVVPLRVRTFLRETKGELLVVKEETKEKKTFKQRRNFDERPKFGTVEDRLFVGGVEGLIPDGPEDEEGQKAREIPDWEKRLNYGEPVAEVKKKKKPAPAPK